MVDERLILTACETLFGVILIEQSQVLRLRCGYAFVIDLWKFVEFAPKTVELRLTLFVAQFSDFGRTDIERMQSERRVGVVGIGILPSSGHSGIIDRQNLYDVLSAPLAPVGKQAQVGELADTETLFRAQRKYRNGNARTTPHDIVAQSRARYDSHGVAIRIHGRQSAVIARFPTHDVAAVIENNELILSHALYGYTVKHNAPTDALNMRHTADTVGIPLSQLGGTAGDAEYLAASQGRSLDLDIYFAGMQPRNG